MRIKSRLILSVVALVVLVPAARPQSPPAPTAGQNAQPLKVSLCELKKDPGAYNRKLIEVTAFVSHGFEDFTLFDPDCISWPHVWLEYGGTVKSGTMYCCGVTAARSRPRPLVVENIPVTLVDDAAFREFDKLIHSPADSVVRATLAGRFFAGEKQETPKGAFWRGYGHMGCCSLLAIQQVLSVEPRDRADLDYGASADQPDIEKTGCGYTHLLPILPHAEMVKAQQSADRGDTGWAFDDPQRVAAEALARLLNIDAGSVVGMKETRRAQGRVVYQWRPAAKKESYMVVVSRPYWLAFYAKDRQRVAWVVFAAYESSCGGGNGVTRVR